VPCLHLHNTSSDMRSIQTDKEEVKKNPATGEDKDKDEGRGQSLLENDLDGLAN